MEKIKQLIDIIFSCSLTVEGGRTYAKAPVWLVVLAALASVRLAIITTVLAVALGMRAQVTRN